MENIGPKINKSFFEKPEGKTGMVFLGLLGIGGALILYRLLPFILTLLTNTLHAMLLIGAISFIVFLVTNPKIRMLVSWGFKMAMRWLTGVFVELNPIAIMHIHISNLKTNHSAMNKHIQALSGEIRQLERRISTNKKDVEASLKIASRAKNEGVKAEAWKHARKAERRRVNTIKLSDLLSQIKKIYNVLIKMYEISGYVIEDLQDDVEQKEIEYKTIKKAHAALKSSMSIINGNPDERAMFELALEKMEEEVSMKLGSMDRFMEMSVGIVSSIDLEQGVLAEDGMIMLEEFENGLFDEFFKSFEDMPSGMSLKEKREKSYNPELEKELTQMRDNNWGVQPLTINPTTNKYF